jgi:hypothetical protein
MRCSACGAELILTSVVPDETAGLRGCEQHSFICSGCHVTERRVVFVKHGREDDSPSVPAEAARGWRATRSEPDEPVATPGLLGRFAARLRGH